VTGWTRPWFEGKRRGKEPKVGFVLGFNLRHVNLEGVPWPKHDSKKEGPINIENLQKFHG